MNTIIVDINNKLKVIIEDLLQNKKTTKEALSKVNSSIKEKIDEAKKYKSSVDDAKNEIKKLENDISSLKKDLSELKEKFAKKDLKGIVEAGNKEINAKIADKQNLINKQKIKISELTEKARSIKDLLINLKKDKTIKEEKLEYYSDAYNYYNKELTKIMTYATENSDNLEEKEVEEPISLIYDFQGDIDESEVFDEIESIDNSIKGVEKGNKEKEVKEKNKPKETKEKIKENEVEEEKKQETKTNKEDVKEEKLLEDPKTDNDSIKPDNEFLEKLKKTSFELDELEETIDLEYSNIFGEELDEEMNIDDIDKSEVDEIPNIFEKSEDIKETEEIKIDLVSFFTKNDLDFNRFDNKSQERLRTSFDEEKYTKVIELLKNNNIDLTNLYSSTDLLINADAENLKQTINNLLLAGQSTINIGHVLNSLLQVDNTKLTDVINSYGEDLSSANITDLIIKSYNRGDA